MTYTAASQTRPLIEAVEPDQMAKYVLLVSWMIKQQQLLKQQQDRLEKQQRELDALKEENAQLSDELNKLKKRSSQNSSVPPSQDLIN